MGTPATRFEGLVVCKRPTRLGLRPTVGLGHSPELKPMAGRLNCGAQGMRRVSDPAYNGNGVGRVTPRGVGDS